MAAATKKRSIVSCAELASYLGVSKTTVLTWVRVGRIPCMKISPRLFRFDLDAVLDVVTVPPRS
ncbi:MAG: helix-turn-helix domain-containing protein [Planctomycetes bacterium]|nr:helix-turn-helix domain-containing protein [Planctomycetota bacterium]